MFVTGEKREDVKLKETEDRQTATEETKQVIRKKPEVCQLQKQKSNARKRESHGSGKKSRDQ